MMKTFLYLAGLLLFGLLLDLNSNSSFYGACYPIVTGFLVIVLLAKLIALISSKGSGGGFFSDSGGGC